MARRKRQFLEDDDDSDSNTSDEDGDGDFGLETNPDLRAERELFEKPYGRKRRRKANGKEDATYGVFADDSEDEGFGGRGKRPEKRSDWAKAPSFISGDRKTETLGEEQAKSGSQEEKEQEQGQEDEDDRNADADGDEDEDDSGITDASSESRPPSPRVRMEEDGEDADENLGMGGIGSSTKEHNIQADSITPASVSFGSGGIGIGKGGIGSSRGGIGSSRPEPVVRDARSSLPSAFGASRPQRSFVRDGSGSGSAPGSRSATPLAPAERAHFSKLESTFGARMLSKMGWQAGAGLGTEGSGIVTPVESKLRPKGMGIAFKGFKEKTEQSKAEARRRGEVVSDDDDEKPKKRGKGRGKAHEQTPREDVWKKQKKAKVKIEHKTYEEIIAEAGGDAPAAGIGKIIDATGATLREVSSLADVSLASWTPSTDPLRIPEVRHNLRLIAEACKVDLDGLAREAKTLEDRKKWIQSEDPRLRRKVEEEAELIRRLQMVHLAVDDISSKAKEIAMSDYEPTLEMFAAPIEKLLAENSPEYDRYHLDEIVVAAIAPTFRRIMTTWRPLEDPSAYTSILRRWKNALKATVIDTESQTQVDVYGTATVSSRSQQLMVPMTPYESLLWNVWLPKVRSCINNDWSATNPTPAVKLLEAWSDNVPAFVRDNVLDQLILPKVSAAIANWSPKRDNVSLQTIVFPWLPHVGLRMEGFVDEARRKVKSMLRSWVTSDGVPKDLLPWKEIFNSTDWEAMLLKNVVPKLGATLRDEFRVNPRSQNMEPLQQVLHWSSILRSSIFGPLLEAEFFPKWLDVLHLWLIQPTANFEEVAQWYQFWKSAFPEAVQVIPAVTHGFTRGLQLMNHALELGADAPTKLPKPDHKRRDDSARQPTDGVRKEMPRVRPSRTQEITFRSIVEDFVAAQNLLFMPAGKVHEKSRMPLFRVSKSVEGRGGLLVYLLDDAVWAPDGDDYRAITLEDMALRAIKTS